ncbi:MAG: C1 family peptidase [Candidatus Zixiibacteriota bacterium]|nr:MAG: C1 family peptidase [candidate division Zixibacteria bacterium]
MAKSSQMKKTKIDDDYLKRYCNVKRDALDPRDYPFVAVGMRFGAPSIPRKVDYSKETRPVGDQGYTGSCVGWATGYGLRRWLHYKATGRMKKFSVRFVWMGSKEYDPFDLNVPFDLSGTRIRDAFKVMRKFGSCSDSLWPFSSQLPHPDYEERIKNDAMNNRIGNYHSLASNEDRRVHLAKEGPFVVGVPVYSNWSSIGSDGVVPDPAGYLRGGHAVLVVGYDDRAKRFKFQNSWGAGWGQRGYGYFTYNYMENYSWNSWGAKRL